MKTARLPFLQGADVPLDKGGKGRALGGVDIVLCIRRRAFKAQETGSVPASALLRVSEVRGAVAVIG